ncbi:VOC family protein [Blastococcus sp. URHD0036]|uniref:VOC family protein n=1 Tax=Blastococcus sp. URHD0036 TaxID=1380356 RepID=UPI000495207B|nr:VOC family protein [Blastococcus sp. URHD0036]
MAKLRHVAIRCDDLDWGAKFYSELFEMDFVSRVGPPGDDSQGAVYLSDGVVNVALIKVHADFPNAKPEGINHIGFVVEDVDAAVARAESLGAVSMMGNMTREEAALAGATWEVKMKTPDGTVAFDISDHFWPGTGTTETASSKVEATA